MYWKYRVITLGAVAAFAVATVGCGDEEPNDESVNNQQEIVAPGVEFVSPSDAQIVDASPVAFEVRITDAPASGLAWSLNGGAPVEKTVDLQPGDTFTETVDAEVGPNTLEITVFASDGTSSTAKVVFVVDEPSAPVVAIDEPASTVVFTPSIDITAAVDFDGALAEHAVTVNDNPVEGATLSATDGGYEVSAQVPLEVGTNDIVVEVVAENGEFGQASLLVTRDEDTEAPTLADLAPHDGRSVRNRQVVVHGVAVDNLGVASVEVTVGDDTVAATLDDDGRFAARVELAPGENTLTLKASDEAGNEVEHTHSLYFGSLVAAGGAHSGAVIDGEVYAWGRNNRGQVGLGFTSSLGDTDPDHPVVAHLVDVPGDVVSIAFTQNSSFALNAAGEVYAWGDNAEGQLCVGDATDEVLDETHRHAPEKVTLTEPVVAIARGYDHTLFLTAQGTVFACGENDDGQLGNGNTDSADGPIEITSLSDVIGLAAGSSASYALTATGDVYAWGDNGDGNLGMGTSDRDPHPQPAQITGLTNVIEIAAGKDHALALTQTGELWGWGLNRSLQVGPEGIGGFESDVLEPVELTPGMPVTGLLAGANQSFVYGDDARAYGWGQNGFGNLGVPEEEDLAAPDQPVFGLEGLVDVSVGALHAVGLRGDGRIFAWGWSFEGSLGAGESAINAWSYRIPVLVEFAE
ncbi:hypothetical protein FIV42_22000 [Persicimonas caeni]|uniref:RCC1-like domain-containing protein n=1 Tax=Persicimonas caeni TaxID=2292766 RepID=A0A4Y6PYS9_PERCE|nr:hypothetical protein [Persicimonas caeni]QDG53319.1 hypothetical protein FIV42_22000 [Persicimonas caeni]QED34541.1 hypothetical protein FRD00_21995 [Persicimonas caeni]